MIRFANADPCVDVHSYLVAFCTLAIQLYPDQDWDTVQPKLARSWERYVGESTCSWDDVREAAQQRWEARAKSA
jgi:hypothetical protein